MVNDEIMKIFYGLEQSYKFRFISELLSNRFHVDVHRWIRRFLKYYQILTKKKKIM